MIELKPLSTIIATAISAITKIIDNRKRVYNYLFIIIIISTLFKLLLFYASDHVASHAGVLSGARTSSLPTNACSSKNNIPFPSLGNHIVPSKFQ